MKIVVGGGLGFIGSHFVKLIAQEGVADELVIIDNMSYAANPDRLSGFESTFSLVRGSIGDQKVLESVAAGVDYFVNFAAETHNDNSVDRPTSFLQTNILELASLASFCAAQGIHLHQVSTDEIYGDTDFDSDYKFTEDSQLKPSSPYSASKAAGDLVLGAWVKTYGLSLSISNCSNNFGPEQHQEKLIPTIFRHLRSGKPVPLYGNGENVRDWIHVKDHCKGILSILERRAKGNFNFGATDEVSNLNLVKAVALALDFDGCPYIFVDDRPGHDKRYAIDWSKANRELNWSPVEKKILDSLDLLQEWY
jgi:dTDP-glucose 4,6-dehydratase